MLNSINTKNCNHLLRCFNFTFEPFFSPKRLPMRTLNNFRFAFILGFTTVFLSLMGCDKSNNSGQPKNVPQITTPAPCPCPQPIISFYEQSGIFKCNPGTLPDAVSVTVFMADVHGVPIDTLTFTPNQDKFLSYNLDTFARPLQLRFVYNSSTGKILGESCLKVDDSGGNGVVIPDVDVIMGFTSTPPPACTSLSNNQVTTGTGQVSFAWDTIMYELRFSQQGGTEKKIRLKTQDMSGDLPGRTWVYNANGYECLNNLGMVNPIQGGFTNLKVLKVSVASQDDCTITGTDNNLSGSPRQINVLGPTGWTITVWK